MSITYILAKFSPLTEGPSAPLISGCSEDECDTINDVSQQPESPLGMAGDVMRGDVYVGTDSLKVTPVASCMSFSAASLGADRGIK